MKKLLIFVMLFVCSLTVQAQTFFTVDNVRYMLEDDHAVVARQDKEGVQESVELLLCHDGQYAEHRLMLNGRILFAAHNAPPMTISTRGSAAFNTEVISINDLLAQMD